MDWFLSLDPEDQEFVKQFLLASGSLKQLAHTYGVSYPTVRVRLDRLIAKVQALAQAGGDPFVAKVMQLVVDEQLSLATAKTIILAHQEVPHD